MTSDELADSIKANLDELHAQIEALEPGPEKHQGKKLAATAHAAFDAVKDHFVASGRIQPFSGGDPKP